jgi:hypothetical protein
MQKPTDPNAAVNWKVGVATSGSSYLVHQFQYDTLSPYTGNRVSMYASKCGSVAVKSIDQDPELISASKHCKRCFK